MLTCKRNNDLTKTSRWLTFCLGLNRVPIRQNSCDFRDDGWLSTNALPREPEVARIQTCSFHYKTDNANPLALSFSLPYLCSSTLLSPSYYEHILISTVSPGSLYLSVDWNENYANYAKEKLSRIFAPVLHIFLKNFRENKYFRENLSKSFVFKILSRKWSVSLCLACCWQVLPFGIN
jgi:hypothetical protein